MAKNDFMDPSSCQVPGLEFRDRVFLDKDCAMFLRFPADSPKCFQWGAGRFSSMQCELVLLQKTCPRYSTSLSKSTSSDDGLKYTPSIFFHLGYYSKNHALLYLTVLVRKEKKGKGKGGGGRRRRMRIGAKF